MSAKQKLTTSVSRKGKARFRTTRPKDVFGSLPYKGPAKSIAEMDAGITAEVEWRHARNRY